MNDMRVPRVASIVLVGAILIAIILGLAAVVVNADFFGILNWVVNEGTVGLKYTDGQLVEILVPNRYTDLKPYTKVVEVDLECKPFEFTDPSMLLKDGRQSIGALVSGNACPPDASLGLVGWQALMSRNANYFLNPNDRTNEVVNQARDAVKNCVGERTFDEAVVGESRGEFGQCIQTNLNGRLAMYHITVNSIAVKDILLSPEVEKSIADITANQSQLLLFQQETETIKAENTRNNTRVQGEIEAEQTRIRATIEQETLNLAAEQERLDAQRAVDATRNENELANANAELETARVHAQTAAQQAEADNASANYMAQIINSNPAYANYLLAIQAVQASANVNMAMIDPDTPPLFFGGWQQFMNGGMFGTPSTPATTP